MKAWFIAPYKRRDVFGMKGRYCIIDDFTAQIFADGGTWSETEILGNVALVKVSASAATLDKIAGTTGFTRLPKAALTDSLADLTTSQQTAIHNKMVSLGYAPAELRAALADDIGQKTLGDLLRFAARRRLKPRFDVATNDFICDGPSQTVRTIESVDRAV